MRHTSGRHIGVLIAIGLSLAACGSDGSSAPSDTAAPATASSAPVSSDTSTATGPERPRHDGPPTPTTPSSTPSIEPRLTATTGGPRIDLSCRPTPVGRSASSFPARRCRDIRATGGVRPAFTARADRDEPPGGRLVRRRRFVNRGDPAHPETLRVRIQRLELCTVLPDGCDNMDDPTEMNLDPTWQLDLDLPLDATTDVVVGGFKCWAAPEQKQGTGIELADLFTAFTNDYDAAVAPLLADGTSSGDAAEQVAAAPTGGFVAEATMCPDEVDMSAGPLATPMMTRRSSSCRP